MSEYWLISAPGEKTCQQTFDTMNNITGHEHNLSINYKFQIPDLKVGTLDQLVGLSDDLGKLDTYVEQITRKVASYLGEVLEDQRDKLHENLLANNNESCNMQLCCIDREDCGSNCKGGNIATSVNETHSNGNSKTNDNANECIAACIEIMTEQKQYVPYNCYENYHMLTSDQYPSSLNHSMASSKLFVKDIVGENNNTCRINQNVNHIIKPAVMTRSITIDSSNNGTLNSISNSSHNDNYYGREKGQQEQQQQLQNRNHFCKYFNKIVNTLINGNSQQAQKSNDIELTGQSRKHQHYHNQESQINPKDPIRICRKNETANIKRNKKILKHGDVNSEVNFNYNDDEEGLRRTVEWWSQWGHKKKTFHNFHVKSLNRRRSPACCCDCCPGHNSHNSSPNHDICQVLELPKSPHPADLAAYITRFQWDMAKYPIKQSLRNIADIISKQVGQIDADLKTKATAYNNLKGNLQNLEKKQTGSLLTRNLADLVKKEHFILDSEYLTTLLVIVPKMLSNDWLTNYEKITDMIVPRSSTLIKQDNDYCLFNVTLFKKVVDEFKLHAREKKFIVRDFEYNEEEMAAGKNEITKLITDKKKQFGPLVRWLKVNFSEAFCALIHVKALRVFVESVLRYGLPVNFQAILIQPHKKSVKRLRECLNQLYGHLDGSSASAQASGLDNVDIPGLGFGQAEYYPYVFYKINIDMVDTK